jgi:uncharacterized protein
MAIGSYFAGSTPMGGGTVGFPVLVMIKNFTAEIGRDFSFAIQSIGMVSASIYILCRKQIIAKEILLWSMLGSLIITPLSIVFIAPLVNDFLIKLIFSFLWAVFGLIHLVKMNSFLIIEGIGINKDYYNKYYGIMVGFIGGIIASITGIGIDLIVYIVLVIFLRYDLKIAIPTSVILMAFTSIVGITTSILFTKLSPNVYQNWVVAAPIVVLGAPFGAIVVRLISRRLTLSVVSLLCIFQYIWFCFYNHLSNYLIVIISLSIVFVTWYLVTVLERYHAKTRSSIDIA